MDDDDDGVYNIWKDDDYEWDAEDQGWDDNELGYVGDYSDYDTLDNDEFL